TLLRDRSSYRVHDAGINRAIELALVETKKADSARAASGPIQPAPGPAPIPGLGSDTARARGTPAPKGTPAPRPAPAPSAPAAPADTARNSGN
ncbi:MAG: hypothetical protein M3Q75_03390, partial [Gemmatimonadota bacterium]|nr:hypothetical protein [Gemmatimonadota bacterium]